MILHLGYLFDYVWIKEMRQINRNEVLVCFKVTEINIFASAR